MFIEQYIENWQLQSHIRVHNVQFWRVAKMPTGFFRKLFRDKVWILRKIGNER